jgi:hypothetical protein
LFVSVPSATLVTSEKLGPFWGYVSFANEARIELVSAGERGITAFVRSSLRH